MSREVAIHRDEGRVTMNDNVLTTAGVWLLASLFAITLAAAAVDASGIGRVLLR